MKIEGLGKLLRIYIGSQDRFRGKPLFDVILKKVKELGMAGGTILRGMEGFGANSRVIHKAAILRLSEDLPVLIEIVDTEKRIAQAVEALDSIIREAGCGVLMTMETVEIIRYSTGKSDE